MDSNGHHVLQISAALGGRFAGAGLGVATAGRSEVSDG